MVQEMNIIGTQMKKYNALKHSLLHIILIHKGQGILEFSKYLYDLYLVLCYYNLAEI